MIIRKLRLSKGWTQEQLAEAANLSVRTVQRAERGFQIGLETVTSLAEALEVDVSVLNPYFNAETQEQAMSEAEQETIEYVKGLKEFYEELIYFLVVLVTCMIINLLTNPDRIWFAWIAVGWGGALVWNWFELNKECGFLSPRWEKKEIEKRLGRKLD